MFKVLGGSLAVLVLFSTGAKAGFYEYWNGFKNNIEHTVNEGKLGVYLPFYAWHNRWTYDRKHIDKYNENAWGFGLGLSYYDYENDWHGLYAMGFNDSNHRLETIYGYAYLKYFSIGCAQNWRAGIGYTLSLTQRHEYSYIPVPLPLPIASIAYKNLSLNAAYVPGVKNDGNVLFTWVKYDF